MTESPVVVGSGPIRVLALPGWFGDSGGWGAFPDLIDTERYTYAFFDYRGYGGRRDLAGKHTNSEISADVLATADDLGWDTFALVGHSMGGKAIQRVYADAPSRVRALVGVCPVHASAFPFDADGWALFDGAAGNDDNRRTIIDFTTGNRHSATWVRRMADYSTRASTRDSFAAYLHAWGKEDFVADLPASGHPPVRVVVGAEDPALNADYVRGTWLRSYPDATLDVLPGAGHYPMWETPVALLTTLEEVLDPLG